MLPEKLAEKGVFGRNIGTLKNDGSLEIEGKTILLEDVSIFKKGQSFAFIMDTRLCTGAFDLAKDVDFLVCESTYLAAEAKDAIKNGHLTAAHAATIAKKSGADKLILTHFSQRYTSLRDFTLEAEKIHPNVVAVSDGEQIEILRKK